MHECFLNPKNEKYVCIVPADDDPGTYLVTNLIQVSPLDKNLKIAAKRKFGLTMNDGTTKIFTGPKQLGMGVKIRYCPFCGAKLK